MKLQDACEFIIDCPHSTASDEGKGYPLIRTPNIGRGRLILEGVHRVTDRYILFLPMHWYGTMIAIMLLVIQIAMIKWSSSELIEWST